jgi:AcrR family transcriptional regulator
MTVSSRKERDRQLRRSDILKAAEHIFALKGYHKATIRDIAKEAQYATGTVYLHFKDKDALYFALFEEKIKYLLSIVEEKTEQAKDSRSKLNAYVQESLAFFEKNQDFFRIFISDENELSAQGRLLRSPTVLQLHEYIAGLLREAQEQGVISADLDAIRMAEVLTAITKTIVIRWLQGNDGKGDHLVDLTGLILRLFLNGTAK